MIKCSRDRVCTGVRNRWIERVSEQVPPWTRSPPGGLGRKVGISISTFYLTYAWPSTWLLLEGYHFIVSSRCGACLEFPVGSLWPSRHHILMIIHWSLCWSWILLIFDRHSRKPWSKFINADNQHLVLPEVLFLWMLCTLSWRWTVFCRSCACGTLFSG